LYSNNILSSLKTEVQEEIDDDASLPKSLIRHSTEYDNENIPEGKLKLGIHKSNLWYQNKKLANVRKINVYGKVLSKLSRN
jgi:hypothetical protein